MAAITWLEETEVPPWIKPSTFGKVLINSPMCDIHADFVYRGLSNKLIGFWSI